MEQTALSTVISIAASCVGFIALTLFVLVIIFRHRQNKAYQAMQLQQAYIEQLLGSQIEIQEDTFNQIGKELHDNVSQLIGSAKNLLNLIEQNATTAQKEIINSTHHTLSDAMEEIRTLAKVLNKEWLAQFSLLDNLQRMVAHINKAEKVQIQLQVDSISHLLNTDQQLLLYRVLQEAIQNAIKHSHCQQIQISCKQLEKQFQFSIIDDGKGMNPTQQNGVGILHMKNRIKALQGSISWLSNQPHGTLVNIQIPYQPIH